MRITQLTQSLLLSAIFFVSTTHAITYEAADSVLNTTYQTANQLLDQDDQAKLKQLQRKWIQYRDQTCELKAKQLGETVTRCKADLTVEHTYFLTLLNARKIEDTEFYATLFSDRFATQIDQYRALSNNQSTHTFLQIIEQLVDDRYLNAYQALPQQSQKILASSFGLWMDVTQDLCSLIDVHTDVGVQFCIGSRTLQQVNLFTLLMKSKG